jgi:twitching motility protein PilT
LFAVCADLGTLVNLLDSLLDAITRLDGDALVMHVGEKPYVVTTRETTNQYRGPLHWGQVELSSRVLTPESLNGMLAQILPADRQTELDEYGAIEFGVTASRESSPRFTIVVARGGDDIWFELRRHRGATVVRVPEPEVTSNADRMGPPEALQPVPSSVDSPIDAVLSEDATRGQAAPVEPSSPRSEVIQEVPEQVAIGRAPLESPSAHSVEEEMALTDHEFLADRFHVDQDSGWADEVMTEGDLREILRESASGMEDHTQAISDFEVVDRSLVEDEEDLEDEEDDEVEIPLDTVLAAARAEMSMSEVPPLLLADESARVAHPPTNEPMSRETVTDSAVVPEGAPQENPAMSAAEQTSNAGPDAGDEDTARRTGARARPAIVVPLTRYGRGEPPADTRGGVATVERVLRLAAARGAATVYVVAQSAPMVRVDGEFHLLEGEPPFSQGSVERLIAEIAPQTTHDAVSSSEEWTIDVEDIGRVRCISFRDQRGPGLIFRIVPPRAISADQLALPADVQALCSEADGLVLVAGGRGSGRSTLLTSFVDLINRTRSAHVITAESQVGFLHENKRSFITQREVPGDAEAMAAAVRAACREDPDVLVIDEIQSSELVTLALEAAQTGCLVLASTAAPSAISAIERMIEMFPPERREKAQASLAAALRGVVSQVLLRKLKGGRVAAREILLNTPAVAKLILEGKTLQLPTALESDQRFGMTSLAESLATLVREGTVHASHAYRKAPNREQFLAVLKRDGIDPGIAERLA